MKEVFISMPGIYFAALAVMYGMTLYAVWFASNVIAKFMLAQQFNKNWKPNRDDMKSKKYAEHITILTQGVIFVIMLMHLTINLHIWSCPFTEILSLLTAAFVPLIILIIVSVIVVAQLTIRHYLKKHINRNTK